ncbi:Permease of the drug/metabolite transporter (DMT) superfamily [gamma proteobacterium IMCC1989]|nr:Permease of the drug/metabolite transporter (DMT) superfamily [gamma proteobacterium IMCC1989]
MTNFQLGIILLTVSVSACAQLLLKLGMKDLGAANGMLSNGFTSLFHVIFSPLVFSGLVVYGISTLSWLWVLSKVDLSIAYPFLGISFIFTLFFGIFLLDEELSTYKLIGTLMIVVGCFLVAKSA